MLLTGFFYHIRFPERIICIQQVVGNPFSDQFFRYPLGFPDRCGHDQHRPSGGVNRFRKYQRRLKLFFRIPEIPVPQVLPLHRSIGRDHCDLHPIYFHQFFFRIGNRPAHSSHFGEQAKQALIGNRCHRTVFRRNRQLFLHLKRLLLSTPELHPRQYPSRSAVQQIQFPLFRDQIFLSFLKKHMCSKS